MLRIKTDRGEEELKVVKVYTMEIGNSVQIRMKTPTREWVVATIEGSPQYPEKCHVRLHPFIDDPCVETTASGYIVTRQQGTQEGGLGMW